MKRALLVASWLLTFAYMGFIFYMSSLSKVEQIPPIPGIDKVLHLGAYGLLAVFWAESLIRTEGLSPKRLFWTALLVASIYGITDEFHQSFVPGREVSALDWLADTCGAAAGAWLWPKLRSRFT